ncbi:pheromone autoinducer 2 transporter [Andreesenia angusta]|uniref:Pheromone autoinducer 2 transporter n=1 Tax=Andreesenia angusta TaxID=39480 RepID=A0A1S1V775_9FIRM|nr:AI-2E family transporter [Andreesenia angusta]OHW62458.1 pheromone autoinducer 2 transporter [Andreesenia angusta]
MIRRKLNYFSLTVVLLLFLILVKDLHQSDFFATVSKILMPFVYGFIIAYILNPIIHYLEMRLNFKKSISILIVYSALLLGLYLFFTKASPKLLMSINNLLLDLPKSLRLLVSGLRENLLGNMDNPLLDKLLLSMLFQLDVFLEKGLSFTSLNIEKLLSLAFGITGLITNLVIGLVISIYMIKDKYRFASLGKKLLYAFLEGDEATSIVNFLTDLNNVFSRFIVGKIIDSAIMAVLFFVPIKLMGADFVLLMSTIFGVTNIVPYFGPLVGIIAVSVISIVYMPDLAIQISILAILLQQFDGLYLGPKILGGKVGLSTFWTMTTILISGGLFGIMGMLLAVPAASVIRKLLNKTIEYRLEHKKIKIR